MSDQPNRRERAPWKNFSPGRCSAHIALSARSGRGAWQPSTRRTSRPWAGMWRSRSCRPNWRTAREFVKRFQQEARIIANLEHPHILPAFDFGEDDGVTYFVMRFLDAGTLKERMNGGALPWAEIDRLFTQLAEALGYAHDHGIVHRDLKPANALVDTDGNLFLTDFGIAKLLEDALRALRRPMPSWERPPISAPNRRRQCPLTAARTSIRSASSFTKW
ncbi:MAG: serine/threonine protein kinase [Ignavibacteriales bacterium]|nr:serine/threonine protein kinase [Ignavibacteriales bacterium]